MKTLEDTATLDAQDLHPEKPLGRSDRQIAIDELKSLQSMPDREIAHAHADGVLCSLLASLGYSDVVDEFERLEKWYS